VWRHRPSFYRSAGAPDRSAFEPESGYAGRLVSWAATVIRLTVTVVKRTDDAEGFTVLPRSWVVERTLAWLTRNRRLVRDYERRTDTYETMTMIALMPRRLARAAAS